MQTKVAKEMDKKDSQITSLTVRTRHPEAELESRPPHKRKKVQYDPNDCFPSIKAIVSAREAAQVDAEIERQFYRDVADDQANSIYVRNYCLIL